MKQIFVIEKIDPVCVEGGDKPYRLLAEAMEKSGRVALAEIVSHRKEKLVLSGPWKGELVLQEMFYANEIRDFNQVPRLLHQTEHQNEFCYQ